MKEVISKSFKDSISGKVKVFFFGGAGSIIAILLFGHNALNFDLKVSVIIGIVLLLIIFLIRFTYFLSKHLYKHYINKFRESIYGDAIILLKDAFAKVHRLRKRNPISDDDFITTMAFTCHQLKLIFDRKTKSKCSVSIKVAIENNVTSNTEVRNLCRDKNSTSRDTERYKTVRHYIFSNTCFNTVFSNLTRSRRNQLYYLNNNIDNSRDYQNTSRECYEDGTLPYHSELVVPIIPLDNEQDKVYNLLGFLCVDSTEKNVFDEKYDLAILQGVADGIYDIIQLRNQP